MKNVLIIAVLAIMMLNAKLAQSQVMAVNTTGAQADTSALLDISDTGKGMLIPRMTTAQRNAIVTPATGLMVYQTDGTAGFYYNSGTTTSPVWTPVGNIPTGTATGDMFYWNGSAWMRVAAGSNGQNLIVSGGVPTWVSPAYYSIVATSGANGTISPQGVTLLLPGTSQVYGITPNTNYHVSDVTVDGTSAGAVTGYTFTALSASHTISAAFAINTYPIVATAGANGTITPTGTTTVSYGGSQAYTITPATHYHISDVTVDGSSVGAVTSYTFSSVSASHTISATFAIDTYPIVATSGANGTVTPSGTTPVGYGGSQAYTMTPGTGYHVSSVTVDGSGIGAVTSYTFSSVSASHTISATFVINTYTLTATAGANGTITPSGTTTVSYGGSQAYSMTPGTGYHVSDVTVDGTSVGAVTSYTFSSVSANHTIIAAFSNTYPIVATTGTGGTLTPSGTTNVSTGGSQAYIITPNAGYYINNVVVDGTSLGPLTSYVFSSVSANHTIVASFSPVTIGMSYGGGKVAYLLQPGDPGYNSTTPHGLIAASSDQSAGVQWYNGSYITTGATAIAIGSGSVNTSVIITSQGAGTYAASICQSYTGGGYTDWYLPSQNELDKLYFNRTAIGGFASAYYSSSSQYSANYMWWQNFASGGTGIGLTSDTYYVRAIRSF